MLAGCGATAALAGGLWVGNGGPNYSHGNFGVGGWNQQFGAGGWKPKANPSSTASSFSSMGAATAASEYVTDIARNSKSFSANTTVGIGSGEIYYDLPGTFGHRSAGHLAHPLPPVQKDADCVFRSQKTPYGNRWRPGCK